MTNNIDLVTDVDKYELKGIESNGSLGVFTKIAYTDIERLFLKNESRFLTKLTKSGFTPNLHRFIWDAIPGDISILLSDNLGDSEPVTDETEFRRNAALLLYTLKKNSIRHGDLTTKNIIVKDNKPMLIDFHQSKFVGESGPDKRPEGDSHWLWKSVLELSPDTSRMTRKWQAIRPYITGTGILDFGCASGDYCLFAIAENPIDYVVGYDINSDAIDFAYSNWSNIGCTFITDSYHGINELNICDTVFFMSVFAHMDKADGIETLKLIIKKSKQLFFETQLHGDGPGPEYLKTDDDVYKLLLECGANKAEKLVTLPVHGREPMARTVWRVI